MTGREIRKVSPSSAAAWSAALSQRETGLRADCERTIRGGLETWEAVVRAVLTIRDKRLYRSTHPTFERYMRDVWGRSSSRMRQLAAWLDVGHNIKSVTDVTLREGQARQLVGLSPENQRLVVQQAEKDGDLTGAHLKNLVSGVLADLSPEERYRLVESEEDEVLDDTAPEGPSEPRSPAEVRKRIERHCLKLRALHTDLGDRKGSADKALDRYLIVVRAEGLD